MNSEKRRMGFSRNVDIGGRCPTRSKIMMKVRGQPGINVGKTVNNPDGSWWKVVVLLFTLNIVCVLCIMRTVYYV